MRRASRPEQFDRELSLAKPNQREHEFKLEQDHTGEYTSSASLHETIAERIPWRLLCNREPEKSAGEVRLGVPAADQKH